MIKSDSIAALAPALLKAQKNMGAALKSATNPHFRSKFADLNSVIDAAVGPLNDAGIAVLQSPAILDGQAVIQTILLHESGEFIVGNSPVVVAKQNDPQSHGAALTYCRRYGLQSMVTLQAEDLDAEPAMGRGAPVKSASATISPDAAGTLAKSTPTGGAKPSFARKTAPTEVKAAVNTGDDI